MDEKTSYTTLVIHDTHYETNLNSKFKKRKPYAPKEPGKVKCFIPGVIQKIHVREGERVTRGDSLLILEAMKMQNDVASPSDGRIKAIRVYEGQMAVKDQVLIEIEPTGAGND